MIYDENKYLLIYRPVVRRSFFQYHDGPDRKHIQWFSGKLLCALTLNIVNTREEKKSKSNLYENTICFFLKGKKKLNKKERKEEEENI